MFGLSIEMSLVLLLCLLAAAAFEFINCTKHASSICTWR